MANRQKSPKLMLSSALDDRSIVLVGLMGAGKTCIGQRLASKTGLSFVDADAEIEAAADCTVEEIFTRYGEQAFRDGERRVITRLLEGPRRVLATGGGAFVNPKTRENVHRHGVSVWLNADLDILVQRVSRRNDRPLLKNGNPRETLERLIEQRYPCYAEADITVDTGNEPPDSTVEKVVDALNAHAAALTKKTTAQ
jgi:shikimate kinase